MSALQSNKFDVLIVGGGVAGSSLGCVLAERGLGVALVEREAVFRDKVKGEGLHPWGYREVKTLGLDQVLFAAGAKELPNWQLYTNRVAIEPILWEADEVNPLPEVTVSHPALQEALISEAAKRGAEVFRPGKVRLLASAERPELEVSVGRKSVQFQPRLIVGADGRNSTVRQWMGAKLRRDPRHHWLGGALFAGITLAEGATHGANFSGGRTFVFPQGQGVARAYLVASDAIARELRGTERIHRFAEQCARVLPEGAFARARAAGPTAVVPNNDLWSSTIASGPFVLIGDAAGANDPSLGHGLSLVFRDVRELRDLLASAAIWKSASEEFERRRQAYFDVLRVYAKWTGVLTVETGQEAEKRRERVARAREADPSAGGFATIFSRGPDGLTVDETSRRHFFGEDLHERMGDICPRA